MDPGLIGAAVTVIFFVLFIAIVWWAYHKDNRKKYEEAANLPFEEDGADDRRA
jgi:cytochrome c oxidase cbb3-type subunit 4